jgi:hypothetical protein
VKRLELPNLSAVFQDVPGGIEVSQSGRTYRARKWRLTNELETVIQTAVRYGFTAFWVEGHPSAAYLQGGTHFDIGSHHITFARSHNKCWVFVVDGSSRPPVPRDVTFNKKLRGRFDRIGQAHTWEHAGGHHLRVPVSEFGKVLSQLDSNTLEALNGKVGEGPYFGTRPIMDLHNEDELHASLQTEWALLAQAAGYSLDSKPNVEGKIPDLVLDAHLHGIFVAELKFSHAGGVEIHQIETYLQLRRIRANAAGRPLRGVLVARDFSQRLLDRANKGEGNVSLYSFSQWTDGRLRLHCVAGDDVLHRIGFTLEP